MRDISQLLYSGNAPMTQISVVIPAYNAEKTIKETVNCVLNQTFSDFELLVINPNSTDQTRDILCDFSDPRLKVLNVAHGSASLNRNRGLAQAKGKYITFLDADDLWTPDKLEAQHQALLHTPAAAVAYSFTDCIDPNNRFLYEGSHADWSGDVYAPLLLSNFIASGSNFMALTDAVRSVGGFDETLSNCEDLDICLRLAIAHPFVPVRQVQILYRCLPLSKSSKLHGVERSNLTILSWAFAHEKASQLQHLKPKSYSNLYHFLSHKALQPPQSPQRLLLSLRYLLRAISWRPSMVVEANFSRLLGKFFATVILPQRLLAKLLTFIQSQRLAALRTH